MSMFREALDQVNDSIFDPPVNSKVLVEFFQLRSGGEAPEKEQISRLCEMALLRKGFYANPPILQNPFGPIQVTDF
jgi:hypothetical protein